MDSTGAQCWCNFLVLLELASNSRDLYFFSPLSDWYSNCQSSQAFLAWYSWQKHKSGSGCSWPTGCALEKYHEFFIFLVIWSLAAEKKSLGELDLSSYSMTCSLAALFLRMRIQSTLKQTAQCSEPQIHQEQKYQVLSTGTSDTKCCGWHAHRAQTTKLTTNLCPGMGTAPRVILGSGNQLKTANYNPDRWCGLN